jgi:integrase
VERFLGKYGNLQTKAAYSFALARYFEWLRGSKGISLSPDELLIDNLRCQANADPTDIRTRKRHTLWLDEYVNSLLLERGLSDSKRNVTAAAVQQFYLKSDSALFGSFEVSMGRPRPRPPALTASDIRKVLGALPLRIQLPLLCVWQSSMEVNRVLSLTWGQIGLRTYPVQLSFYGRKKHRQPYGTFLGRESIDRLKLWRGKWRESGKRSWGGRPRLHREERSPYEL